jgi:hypothetical protein
MNSGVELHDSRVAEIQRSGEDLRVVFRPAYVHRSDGIPGRDSGWGYLQPVEFTFRGATYAEMGECTGSVAHGEVLAGDLTHSNLVPLPVAYSGETTARLEFASGGVLTVTAEGFSSEAIGEVDPNFRERYEG